MHKIRSNECSQHISMYRRIFNRQNDFLILTWDARQHCWKIYSIKLYICTSVGLSYQWARILLTLTHLPAHDSQHSSMQLSLTQNTISSAPLMWTSRIFGKMLKTFDTTQLNEIVLGGTTTIQNGFCVYKQRDRKCCDWIIEQLKLMITVWVCVCMRKRKHLVMILAISTHIYKPTKIHP